MKTLIVALDGFEHSLIDEWGFNEFKQKIHGTYDAGMIEKLTTPICFSAILTGMDPRAFDYTFEYITKGESSGYTSWLRPFYWFRRTFLKKFKDLGFRKRAGKAGFFQTQKIKRNMSETMKQNTILYKMKNEGFKIVTDNIPSYDEVPINNYRGMLIKYIGSKYNIRRNFILEIMDSMKIRWLKNIEKLAESDILFVYFPLPDYAHHLIHKKNEMKMLKEVYDFIRKLPFLFNLKNVAVLIISDHGYKHKFNEEGKDIEGNHNPLGFWSLNIDIGTIPKTIFDFSNLIYSLVTL